MKKIIVSALLAAAVLGATSANATISVIDFDAVTTGTSVGAFYAGAFGVTFTNFTTATGFGQTSQPNLAFNNQPTAWADFTTAFTSLSGTNGAFTAGTLNVYSGLGGTGTLVGTTTLTGNPYAFSSFSVALSGSAHSFVLTGGAAQVGIDDLTFNSVPEPASWALMIVGFGMVGATMRRRKAALAS